MRTRDRVMGWIAVAAFASLLAEGIWLATLIGPGWWKFVLMAAAAFVGVAVFITVCLWPIRNVEGPL